MVLVCQRLWSLKALEMSVAFGHFYTVKIKDFQLFSTSRLKMHVSCNNLENWRGVGCVWGGIADVL